MNKYALLAIFWFIIGIYALLFRESTNDIPPFPHFDKVSHFCLILYPDLVICKRLYPLKERDTLFRVNNFCLTLCFHQRMGSGNLHLNQRRILA